MAKLSIVAGATNVSVPLVFFNSSSATGAGLTGVAPAGGALLTGTIAYYSFLGSNAAAVAISLSVLATVGAAWSSGGIVTIDDTHMAGAVRFDIPNAVLAAAKGRTVLILFSGGTNMAPLPLEIELTGWDNQDAVRGGLSALPNANAGASGGLPTLNASLNVNADAKAINAVSTASVTAVNANLGTGQPVNFTGTGGSALAQVDTRDWGGTTVGGMPNSGKVAVTLAAADVTGNLPAQLANGVAHGGATATLELGAAGATPPLYVHNSGGDGAQFLSTGGNGNGVTWSGNGTGDGFRSQAGSTGRGFHAIGGSLSGAGFRAESPGTTAGFEAISTGTGPGMACTGGANASTAGLVCSGGGGIGGSTGNGILMIGGSAGFGMSGTISTTITGSMTGDVQGKVLGGGSSSISGTGAQVQLAPTDTTAITVAHLATMIVIVGAGPNYQFTAQALALAPGGADPLATDIILGGYSGNSAGAALLDIASHIAANLDESTAGTSSVKRWNTPATTQAHYITTPTTRTRQ